LPGGSREHLWPDWIHEKRAFGAVKSTCEGSDFIIHSPEITANQARHYPCAYNVTMPAQLGDQNTHGQVLLEKTAARSPNHPFATVWLLRCPKHGPYRANSCDFHIRKCPEEGGKPGLTAG
jgi:hypothetical protein